jgi:hypothetical protein
VFRVSLTHVTLNYTPFFFSPFLNIFNCAIIIPSLETRFEKKKKKKKHQHQPFLFASRVIINAWPPPPLAFCLDFEYTGGGGGGEKVNTLSNSSLHYPEEDFEEKDTSSS